MIFIRALSLPSTIKNRLITDLNLDFLSHFMQQYSTLKPIKLPLDKLNPWTRRALNIKAIHNFSTDTVIMISNQLIWPLMGTIVAKGIINVNLPMSISNNSTDTINHAGTTMVAINENLITGSKQQTNTLYYHFLEYYR
ncbi:hypothetical protein REG_1642 [Candidatus Regiella insecticola LSR1]|uniref:Uncharacterized protein n=1 Tax=Candidatus Regiella insecticola LSR1 TaxID=663321 RepID=E0WU72_9ENTR|nr:hypothetical protein [Candidatus Regiella insecticola]EFL91444.1 hypothetical protein REG_1642 [Candidatus Regiella insecticola LSR1]